MRVLIVGGTGFVGTRLALDLLIAGHDVAITTRNPSKAQDNSLLPIKYYLWSDQGPDQNAVDEADAIINLMGDNISHGRWTKTKKERIYKSRVEGTRALVVAIEKRSSGKLKSYIGTSAIGFYGPRGKERLSENSTPGHDFLAKVCADWEVEHEKLSNTDRLNIIRIGMVVGPNGGAMEKMLPPFKMGVGGTMGNGKQTMNWIHLYDLSRMFVHLLENGSGIYNGVASPITNYDFTKTLGGMVNRPTLFPLPAPLLKVLFGEMSCLFLDDQYILNDKIKETGFQFLYESADKALNQVCGERKAIFETAQWVPLPIEQVYDFFSNPKNLMELMPPGMSMEPKADLPERMSEGLEVKYRLSNGFLAINWWGIITGIKQNEVFYDEQIRGPFKHWRHRHGFVPYKEGTLIIDFVEMRPPLDFTPIAEFVALNEAKKTFRHRQIVVEDKIRNF